jgi:hypothetical protein
MNEDLLDYWLRMIRPVFPATAWIASSLSHGDYLIQIDWKLANDPSQPNKRSRKIQIIIKEKTIDDYLEKTGDGRTLSDIKMIKWLTERYIQYNSEHDGVTSGSASVDTWRISSDLLRP